MSDLHSEDHGKPIGWTGVVRPPIGGRFSKPRTCGITMVMDKGRGIGELRDLLNCYAEYIDVIKLGFGTSALYPPMILQEKIHASRNCGCGIYPGGTFLEIAFVQRCVDEFLQRARELGFTSVEVSDGTIEMSLEERSALIRRAISYGFSVLSEVGKKDPKQKTSGHDMARVIQNDLEAGAAWVIIEGRESGRGVGIYDREGHIEQERFEALLAHPGIREHIIWEAPLKEQQETLIRLFGPNVNLGNIPPQDVLALESMRQGLRNDTFRHTLAESVR